MIHYFNPGHEVAVFNATPSYTPPASLTALQHDLAALPLWYAQKEEVVLVHTDYDRDYFNALELQFDFGKLIVPKELKYYNNAYFLFWGLSPHSIRLVEFYNKEFSLNLHPPVWDDKYIYLNTRLFARDVLSMLRQMVSAFEEIPLPQFCESLAEVEVLVANTEKQLLIKAPYSSSGRGLLWLPQGELTRTEHQIIQGILNKQNQFSVEEVFDKQVDFAMEFYSDGVGGIHFFAYSLFETTSKGAYKGNILDDQESITAYLEQYIPVDLLEDAKSYLATILSEECGNLHKGYIGVDMMVYQDSGEYKLHPCVEINLRCNMGIVSICFYQKYVRKGSEGRFYIDFDAHKGGLLSTHQQMEKEYPLLVKEGRIESGYLSLCPVHPDSRYRAYVLVDQKKEED